MMSVQVDKLGIFQPLTKRLEDDEMISPHGATQQLNIDETVEQEYNEENIEYSSDATTGDAVYQDEHRNSEQASTDQVVCKIHPFSSGTARTGLARQPNQPTQKVEQ